MALLGTFIDSRTLAAIAAAGSSSYAHGIAAGAPDMVEVYENTTTDSTTNIKLAWKYDATNVSIYNHGAGDSATLRAVAVYFHSIQR